MGCRKLQELKMKKNVVLLYMAINFNVALIAESYVNRLFPLGSPPAKIVDVADIIHASPDLRLAAMTLQGIVNCGKEAKLYCLAEENCQDLMWLELIKKQGYIDSYNILSIEEVFRKYSDLYRRVIVYDSNLASTINIATMIAAADGDAIVISEKDIERFSTKDKQTVSLKGKWRSNIEAYEWAYENLFDKMNKKVMACYHPNSIPHNLRDYLVANKIFTFWITSREKQDGVKSDFEKEKAFAEKLFAQYPPNTPVLGFWYSEKDSGINEYSGVGLAGLYGLITYPCDWNTNLSFHSGIKIDWKKVGAKYRSSRTCQKEVFDKNKIYVCFAITDSGDSPMYWQAAEHKVWQDEKMGQIPISWSLGPGCIELTPVILEWFYDNIPAEDRFFLGYSGAGYTHPYQNLFSKTKSPEKAWAQYFDITDFYMNTLDIEYVCLYTDAWKEFSRKEKDPLTAQFADNLPKVEAFIMGMGRDEAMTAEKALYCIGKSNVLVIHVMTRWDTQSIGRNAKNNQWLADEIRKNSPQSGAGFVMVHPLSWSYYASDLVEVMNLLGEDYEVVSLPTFVDFAKTYGISDRIKK
jgi:hypothetical protein